MIKTKKKQILFAVTMADILLKDVPVYSSEDDCVFPAENLTKTFGDVPHFASIENKYLCSCIVLGAIDTCLYRFPVALDAVSVHLLSL